MQALTQAEFTEKIGNKDPFVVFKHSYRCSISSVALSRFEKIEPEINQLYPVYLVDVVEERALSNFIAESSRVQHQSPQILVFGKSGKVIYHESHFGIDGKKVLSLLSSES